MTADQGEGGGEFVAALPVRTDEQFRVTVESDDVLAGDQAAWALFERFLGGDPVTAWVLAEITHAPFQVTDADGVPTGEWKLASSAIWTRDPDVPSPPRVLAQTERPAEV